MTETTCAVKVGQLVPNFELETYDPKTLEFAKVSLEEIRKKRKWTVLFFYPADYTFVCPTELDDVAKKYAEMEKAGAQVISVSTDTKFVHLAWQREEGLLSGVRYQMGSDPTGKLARLFGVYDEETGLALRGTFIISPDGRLVGTEVNFYNVGRNADELLRKVKANAYLLSHPDEACPARWKEGDRTLTPGPKLVGKVGETLNK